MATLRLAATIVVVNARTSRLAMCSLDSSFVQTSSHQTESNKAQRRAGRAPGSIKATCAVPAENGRPLKASSFPSRQ